MENLQDLESKTYSLVKSLRAERDSLKHGEEIRSYQEMLNQIDQTLATLDNIPVTDEKLQELKNTRSLIQERLSDLEVIAGVQAFKYASQQSPKDLAELTPIHSSLLLNGQSDKKGIRIAFIIVLMIVVTFLIGSMRLKNTVRSGPYIPNPPNIVN